MDTVLKQVAFPEDYFSILRDVHVLSCGQRLAQDHTVWMVKWQGYWWPTLHEDAAEYVRACVVCRAHDPLLHATLYHTMGIPKYAQHIFDYLTSSTISDRPNPKKRLVILESQRYRIIGKSNSIGLVLMGIYDCVYERIAT